MINIIIKILIIYLIYRIVTILIHKSVMYYRAYKSLQQRKRREEQARRQRRQELDLRAFDIEDATYEEIGPGQEDRQ